LIEHGVAAPAVAAGAGGTYAWAGGNDDGESQATGTGGDRARAAALAAHLGGVTANAVERDSETAVFVPEHQIGAPIALPAPAGQRF
jgi:hypothetical protein